VKALASVLARLDGVDFDSYINVHASAYLQTKADMLVQVHYRRVLREGGVVDGGTGVYRTPRPPVSRRAQ
jgi:hypothetical protein